MPRQKPGDVRRLAAVDDFRRSGLTQPEFCRRRGLPLHTFRIQSDAFAGYDGLHAALGRRRLLGARPAEVFMRSTHLAPVAGLAKHLVVG